MFDDASSADHHFGMRLHSLLHSLESLFVQMARDVSAFGVGALRFNRAACAVADLRLVDPAFVADLLKESAIFRQGIDIDLATHRKQTLFDRKMPVPCRRS